MTSEPSEYRYTKPVPEPDEETEPFWTAVQRHELVTPRCQQCGRRFFPPRPMCPDCNSLDIAFEPVSGRGQVHSFVVFHQVFHPAFRDDLPYNVVQIALEEEPRLHLTSNVVECENDDIAVGMAVEVFFDDVDDGVTIPRFRPVT